MLHSATKSVDLGKLCRSILNSDHNIQAVKIISKAGLTLEKSGSDATRLNEENRKENSGRCLFDISLGEELDDLYGPIQYNFSEGNFASLIFPFDENLIVVTTTKNISPISVATKIAYIIIRFN